MGFRPRHSAVGIVSTAETALVMILLARQKSRIGDATGNRVLQAQSRVTMVDAILALSVLAVLALNTLLGWWWADPLSGYVILFYAVREIREVIAAQIEPQSDSLERIA